MPVCQPQSAEEHRKVVKEMKEKVMPKKIAKVRMRQWMLPALASVALLVGTILALAVANYRPNESSTPKPGLDADKLALSFEPNDGQASAPARFIARAPGS